MNDIRIWKKDHHILIESDQNKILKVEVYNMHGRILHSNKNVNAKQYKISSALLGTQIIVVTAQTETGETVTKKIINTQRPRSRRE